MRPRKIIFGIFPLLFWLAACGGGGGHTPPQARVQTATPTMMPTMMTQKPKAAGETTTQQQKTCADCASIVQNQKRGTASTYDNAVAKLTELRQSGVLKTLEQPVQTNLDLFQPFKPIVPDLGVLPIAATDTKADEAWKMGWTGKGVKMAVVDDYCDFEKLFFGGSPVSHGERTRGVALQIAPEAGVLTYHIPLSQQSGCPTSIGEPLYREREVDGIFENYALAFNAALAASARVISASFSPSAGNFKSDLENRAQKTLNSADFLLFANPSSLADENGKKALFVFSAGNKAKKCQAAKSSRHIEQCAVRAAALIKLRNTKPEAGDRVIFVGAVTDNVDEGDLFTMADYSLTAGTAKNDFIVAHDDVWRRGDSSGTSFAAPRVAGTAALVAHKWPDLSGAGIKQVLLLSADDLGQKGPDAVFGHGKLNAASALSPIDGLSAK